MQIDPPTRASAFLRETCPKCGHYPLLLNVVVVEPTLTHLEKECVNPDCDYFENQIHNYKDPDANSPMSKLVFKWPGKVDQPPVRFTLSRPKIFFTQPDAQPIDYQALLQKYMAHIVFMRATNYLEFCKVKTQGIPHAGVPFTKEELAYLQQLTEL